METVELVVRLILAFTLFCALGALATIALFKMFFKPMTEEELSKWKQEEVREWKTTSRTLKPKRYLQEYSMHRKAS